MKRKLRKHPTGENMSRDRSRPLSRSPLSKWIAFVISTLMVASMAQPVSAANDRPWEGFDRLDQAVGQGFTLNAADVTFIYEQIKISEQHANTMATVANPDPVGDPFYCSPLIGPGPNQIPQGNNAVELPLGLRVLDGSCNNLIQGQGDFGAADEPFIRLTTPVFDDAEDFDPDGNGPTPPIPTTYNGTNPGTGGAVVDSTPRLASNLIVDQTSDNPAAVAAGEVLPSGSVDIPNVAPDEGLSAPYNDMFTFFGQFFDHGLDLKTTTNELVYMPLRSDDPLYIQGSPLNFMVIDRTTTPGTEALNRTTPYVDQNQTYSSHPSHQVFLREYELNAVNQPVGTGRLIVNSAHDAGMATWDDMQAQAETLLGITLGDNEVGRVPLLATDVYGKFIPGPARGMPMLITGPNPGDFIEGDPANPVDSSVALATGHAFLLDISNFAAPGEFDPDGPFGPAPGVPKTPDADNVIGNDNDPTTFDDEMLGAHFMAGDGRVNENIALTSVHHVFHSEHNRIANQTDGQIIEVLQTQDPASIPLWQLPNGDWNGEYLFQAGKFVTEMEYQHLAFEEFARKVQPQVNAFAGYDTTINAAISGEFAHSVYRFGHSMLNDEVLRYDENGVADNLTLIDAFLNPPAFMDGGQYTPDQAAGAVFRGGTTQVGQEIDEFVVEALRNNLLGLPLDLATINIARGREAGIPSLNEARAEFFAATGDSILAPYSSWVDFKFELRHQESLANFVAAHGTHSFITTYDPDGAGPIEAESIDARRAAAEVILDTGVNPDRPADANDFINGTGTWAGVNTGIDDVDLWSGGLAEGIEPFGGLLGPTLNFVFELQMENLQDGDRFYYLHRTAGLNLLTALEGNSFAELIERNTDVTNLPADVFSRPDYFFDVGFQNANFPNTIGDDPATTYDETNLPTAPDSELVRTPNGTVRFAGGEHANMVGGPGADRIRGGIGDDTIRGNDGNDRLEGDSGNDAIIGGEGDDIITDSFGDDGIKGGPGNDAIAGGQGFDLLQGGDGSDFIVQGSDPSETFGGLQNDFIFGGASAAILFGDYGDDWLEGGGQADLIQGDNGNPFQDDPNGGHDVLNGNGGADDYDAEGGDDILVASPGTSRFEGMLGFDFVTFKDFTTPVDADMDFNGLVPDNVEPLRDRYDLVEGVSGWTGDDVIRGDSFNALLDGPGNEATQGLLDRTAGLSDLIGPGFNAGNVLLGGGGSDLIEGRGENDIIDGDRWLNVQLDVNGARYDSMLDLQTDVFNGTINPGDITIVREILSDDSGTDTAYFEGLFSEYIFGLAGDTLFVDHSTGCGDDTGADDCAEVAPGEAGTDTGVDQLRNIEVLQFLDFTVNLDSLICNGQLATVVLNLGYVHPQFGLTPTIGNDTIKGTSASETIDALNGADLVCAGGGNDTIHGGDGADIIFGEDGNDTIFGDNGGDQLIGQAGVDTIDGGNDADYVNGGIGDDIITNVLGGNDTLEGGPGNDTITGGPDIDLVIGHEGDDTLAGGAGLDYLWGGPGVDSYDGGPDRDTLDGNDAGEDIGEVMNGGDGDDDILGFGGNDTLIGGLGGDYLWGSTGLDTFEGGGDSDYLDGFDGGEDLGETMNGGDGADFVIGWGGDDILDGGLGDNDYVWGGLGADTLSGGDGVGDICQDPDNGTFDASCEFQIP